MALGPGSIAFAGFNGDGSDNLAFVVLEEIASGTGTSAHRAASARFKKSL